MHDLTNESGVYPHGKVNERLMPQETSKPATTDHRASQLYAVPEYATVYEENVIVYRHFLGLAVFLVVSASRSWVNVQVYHPKGEDYSASMNSPLPALC